MKILLVLASFFIVKEIYSQQAFYDFSLTTSDNHSHNLGEYRGKKIWLVILPATQTSSDSAFLARIDSISLAHKDQMTTIVVPSNEDGYSSGSSSNLMQWYRAALDASIVISQPLYTHVSSGGLQNAIFSWVTHSQQNSHFDFEINGPGTMFFIDEQGTLYSVFGAESKWSNRVLNHALQ